MNETPWTQVNIAFPGQDPRERERQAVGHLARTLPAARASGLITSWFFIRKGRWRVRYLPTEQATSRDECPLHPLLTQGVDWTSDIYEPEVHAFGGRASMDTAHELFHADSRHLLAFLSGTPSDRREQSLILCTAFMRAAGLEFGEQGDVWAQIAEQRSALRGELPAPSTWASFTDDVRRLLLGKARPDETASDWLTAFEEAGRQLRALRESGQLTRGIRAVTALHVIFHWNRIGITGATQAVLAQVAKEAIFGAPSDPAPAMTPGWLAVPTDAATAGEGGRRCRNDCRVEVAPRVALAARKPVSSGGFELQRPRGPHRISWQRSERHVLHCCANARHSGMNFSFPCACRRSEIVASQIGDILGAEVACQLDQHLQ